MRNLLEDRWFYLQQKFLDWNAKTCHFYKVFGFECIKLFSFTKFLDLNVQNLLILYTF
jgi:hypothetical protein